jgi:type IV fimbrial biogenesis protein FimT
MTMVEIIVVIAIVAILAMIAVPSFVSSTQRIRVASNASSLFSAMTFARSEAIKRGIPVTICASSNGTACLGTTVWETGWMVFTDVNANGTVGTILKVQPKLSGSDTFRSSNSAASVTFSRDGFAMGFPTGVPILTFTAHSTPDNVNATKCVALSKTGRMATQAAGTGSCA